MEKRILQGDELDLLALGRNIWLKKFLIFKITGVFLFIGIVIAFTSKVEYEAQCKLLPEIVEGALPNLGGLGGLAGLAGINLNMGSSSGLGTQLYPEIIKSTPFLTELVNTPVQFERIDTIITSFQYFQTIDNPSLVGLMKEFTLGLPGKIVKIFRSEDGEIRSYGYIRFSEFDWEIIENFSERISVLVDEETGTVTIITEMPDPVAAAQVTDQIVKQLTKKISEYKTEKSRINLAFVSKQFQEAKSEYEEKQIKLARFTDSNRNISNSMVQNEFERLQNEMNIAFEVYKSLATQLEQAKIKLKEDTPVFTVLEPIKIPEDKSKPNRLIILIAFGFLGFAWAVIKVIWNSQQLN